MDNIIKELNEKYETSMVIGLMKDGKLDLNMSHPNYQTAHWLLNKTLFEIMLLERESNLGAPQPDPAPEKEQPKSNKKTK